MMRSDQSDRLAALLQSADADTPPPATLHRLAENVRARAKRQHQRRRAVVACAGVVSALALTAALLRPTHERTPVAQTRNFDAEAKQAALEAEVHLAVAKRLTAVERRRSSSAALHRVFAAPAPTRAERVASQREQAALTLLDHADRLRGHVDRPADALVTYRRTVELFPDTPSAEIARRRIEQLESQPKT